MPAHYQRFNLPPKQAQERIAVDRALAVLELSGADRAEDRLPCQPVFLARRFFAERRALALPDRFLIVHPLRCPLPIHSTAFGARHPFPDNEAHAGACLTSTGIIIWFPCCVHPRSNGDGAWSVRRTRRKIGKWTLLPDGIRGQELLRLVALACAGSRFMQSISAVPRRMRKNTALPLRIEYLMAAHAPADREKTGAPLRGSGMEAGKGKAVRIIAKAQFRHLDRRIDKRALSIGSGNSGSFFLGFGSPPVPYRGGALSSPAGTGSSGGRIWSTRAASTPPPRPPRKSKD